MRNVFTMIALVVSIALGVGLWATRAELSKTSKDLDEAKDRISSMVSDVEEAQDKAETLEQRVDDFDSEDWRDVVPDVGSQVRDLKSELDLIDTSAP